MPELRGGRLPEEVAEQALRRLLRGGTWEALTREIAWHALRATGAENSWLDGLTALVEARLGDAIDALERGVERVCVSATAEHLRSWPHDREGAETIAVLDGREEAAQVLSRVYVDVLEWAIAVIGDRQRRDGRSVTRGLRPLRSDGQLSKVELPELVIEELRPRRARFGWPALRSAVPAKA